MLTGDAGREALQEVIDYAPLPDSRCQAFGISKCLTMVGGTMSRLKFWINWLAHAWTACLTSTTWNAICSSAKADEDHPRKSVIRAVLHRGGHWAATESQEHPHRGGHHP
jgi:hypothetical protein